MSKTIYTMRDEFGAELSRTGLCEDCLNPRNIEIVAVDANTRQAGNYSENLFVPSMSQIQPCYICNYSTLSVDIAEIVALMTGSVYSMSMGENDTFNRIMSQEHRTHQQSFTRMCVNWLKFIGADTYLHDLRNKDSHRVGQEFLKCLRAEYIDPYLPHV